MCGNPGSLVAFTFDSVLNQLVGLTNVPTRLQLLGYLSRHSRRGARGGGHITIAYQRRETAGRERPPHTPCHTHISGDTHRGESRERESR